MIALEHLDAPLADPSRQAVPRRELQGSRSAAHRALRRRCDNGTLVRIGRAVYARRQACLFDVVPEVLPKLGFRVLTRQAAINLGNPAVTQALRELRAPEWETTCPDYRRLMGQPPVRALCSAFSYPTWRPVLQSVVGMALDLDLVSERDLPEVKQIVQECGRGR